MTSCVPEGRNLTCCLSSQSLHPLLSLVYHQVEVYRASKRYKICIFVYICVHLDPAMKIGAMLLLCFRRNCIISAYYQQRETHKPTLLNVSTNNRYLILTVMCHFTCLMDIFFPCSFLPREWEAPEKLHWIFTSEDPQRDCN